MSTIHSIAPVAAPSARILILGTMPGTDSLKANRYYAHSRNKFWRLMGEIFGFDLSLPYGDRLEALRSNQIALWDVLKLCIRDSALDKDIDEGSIVPNDFRSFYLEHPNIHRVCFNGAKAADLYTRRVQPQITGRASSADHIRLPSTSPANTRVSYDEKLRAWSTALASPPQAT